MAFLCRIPYQNYNLAPMDSFWNHCLRNFEKSLPAQQYKTWIQPLHARLDQHTVVVSAPNRFVLEWVKDKFVPEIERLSSEYLRKPTQVILTLSENVTEETSQPAPEAEVPVPKPKIREQSRLNPTFTFDSFVTGKANQLARAAALQVAEHPGVAYNPLFVYGGVGLGKTHLIQAIGNLLLELNPSAKVRYIHAERYVSDVVRAYQHKAFDGFKKYYHSLDLLLIDDIQFFSGKNRTQEEFFYAFNALIEAHKQVIITCDTYPKEIAGIEDRLISRFGWGLTVAIEPPELEMRVAILLKKAEAERISLPEDIAFFVANSYSIQRARTRRRLETCSRVRQVRQCEVIGGPCPRGAEGSPRRAGEAGVGGKYSTNRRRLLQDQSLGDVFEETLTHDCAAPPSRHGFG